MAVPPELHFRAARVHSIKDCAKQWWARLIGHTHPTSFAQDLYAGDHWSVIRELPALAVNVNLRPHLWVASAGYGLIAANAPVRPYSATFSRGHADSISVVADQKISVLHRQWWQALSEEVIPGVSIPRSVRDLAKTNPSARILVVASPSYVAALEEDLLQTARALRKPSQLVIVSTPSLLAKGKLAQHWIPSSAHLQPKLGGALLSLHARVARDLLRKAHDEEIDFLDAPRLQAHYEQLIQCSAPPKRHERTPIADTEVRQFIEQLLRTESLSCTAALRRLRDNGLACEQQRFKRIFAEYQERA